MFSLKTIQSVHDDRRSPRIPAGSLTPINRRPLPNRPSSIPGISNHDSSIFGHTGQPKRRPLSPNIHQTTTRISIDSIAPIPRKPNNTNKEPRRLSVSASKSRPPNSPSNYEIPNDPNPISGHSTTALHAKSATSSAVAFDLIRLDISKAPRDLQISAPPRCIPIPAPEPVTLPSL
jgi:hypothetical protein